MFASLYSPPLYTSAPIRSTPSLTQLIPSYASSVSHTHLTSSSLSSLLDGDITALCGRRLRLSKSLIAAAVPRGMAAGPGHARGGGGKRKGKKRGGKKSHGNSRNGSGASTRRTSTEDLGGTAGTINPVILPKNKVRSSHKVTPSTRSSLTKLPSTTTSSIASITASSTTLVKRALRSITQRSNSTTALPPRRYSNGQVPPVIKSHPHLSTRNSTGKNIHWGPRRRSLTTTTVLPGPVRSQIVPVKDIKTPQVGRPLSAAIKTTLPVPGLPTPPLSSPRRATSASSVLSPITTTLPSPQQLHSTVTTLIRDPTPLTYPTLTRPASAAILPSPPKTASPSPGGFTIRVRSAAGVRSQLLCEAQDSQDATITPSRPSSTRSRSTVTLSSSLSCPLTTTTLVEQNTVVPLPPPGHPPPRPLSGSTQKQGDTPPPLKRHVPPKRSTSASPHKHSQKFKLRKPEYPKRSHPSLKPKPKHSTPHHPPTTTITPSISPTSSRTFPSSHPCPITSRQHRRAEIMYLNAIMRVIEEQAWADVMEEKAKGKAGVSVVVERSTVGV
ncbi:hypothetical protein DFS34DRAFT_692361 [Phlyctochytrium arcticum]|nr:hypothetical protein DFS34DRAFT_692361 [Phlyctochytrium arcticum]